MLYKACQIAQVLNYIKKDTDTTLDAICMHLSAKKDL